MRKLKLVALSSVLLALSIVLSCGGGKYSHSASSTSGGRGGPSESAANTTASFSSV